MIEQSPTSSRDHPLLNRSGLRVIDWNVDRRPQGIPGHEISSLFSVVVGEETDTPATRFVHVRMKPDSPPRLWHSHPGWTATMILEGSIDIEGLNFTEGQMVVVGPNISYGPLQPGPNGASFIEIFADGAAADTVWDESDTRVAEYRRLGWIPNPDGLMNS